MKKLLCLAIVLSMVLAIMPSVKASPTSMEVLFVAINDTTIDPPTSELISTPEQKIKECDNLTVAIHITDVVDLWSWKVRVTWDPLLKIVGDPWEGEFHPASPTMFLGIPSPGEIPELSSTSMKAPKTGVDGSGNLVYIMFHVLDSIGETYIRILDIDVMDVDGATITIDPVTDGHLELPSPPPIPPIANFAPETCTKYYLDVDLGFVEVEFNAASSVPGFDGDNDCPIVEYRWDFDGDSVFDENVTSAIISHSYTEIGDKNVTLEVYAPGIGNIDPGYIDTDSESHIIHILAAAPPVPPVGSVIDLYTQKEPYSGKGANQPSDAFAPGEEVVLFANVTYNSEPVANVQVGFEVTDPLGRPYVYRINSTGEDGIATTSFRLGIEDTFGVWSVFASASIVEDVIMDTLTFRFGWIVEIVSLVTVNKDLRPQGRFAWGSCVGVKLVLRNIAMMSKNATFTVIIQDEEGTIFPDKVIFEDFVVKPGDTYFYFCCILEIPEWASFGEAVASASAFTAPPAEGGVPWCPGVSTTFLITWCDVAVVSVVPSVREVEVGGVVEVNVDVINEGYEVESFNVSLYYDQFLIGERNVTALAPGGRKTLFFVWNTSGVAVDDYRLKAVASVVPGEADVDDNVFEDGVIHVVEVRKPPAPAVLPRELLVLLLISVGAAAFTGILYLWYRKSEEMSRSGYEGDSSRTPFRSNPEDFGSSVKFRKSASLRPREDRSYLWKCKESDSYQKFREVSSLLQPRESVSSGGRSRDVSPAEFREALSSLRRRKRFSGSSVFAVICLPFVEEG